MFKDLIRIVGLGTPLHIVEDGAPGTKYMEGTTLCTLDITDPEFQTMYNECEDKEVDSIDVRDERLFIVLKHRG